MSKYYQVTLYDVISDDYYDGMTLYLDYVVVKKGLFHATDILTGQKFPIIPKQGLIKPYNKVTAKYRNQSQFDTTDHQLVVLEEEFTPVHIATMKDVADYVDSFEESAYSKVYEELKENGHIATPKEPKTVHQLVKQVSGTRR